MVPYCGKRLIRSREIADLDLPARLNDYSDDPFSAGSGRVDLLTYPVPINPRWVYGLELMQYWREDHVIHAKNSRQSPSSPW